jgi:predicted DNA-binding transcriptional regulator AlpA
MPIMKVLTQRDLPAKGIAWSREHTRRMVNAGKFPDPFKLTEKGKNYWDEAVIDAWLEEQAKKATPARLPHQMKTPPPARS